MSLSSVLTTAQTEYQTRVGALAASKHPSVEQLAILDHLQTLLQNNDAKIAATVGGITDVAIPATTNGTLTAHIRQISAELATLRTRLAGDQYPIGAVPLTDNNATLFVLRQAYDATSDTYGLPQYYKISDGSIYTPTGAVRLATSTSDRELISSTYTANTTGTGYAVGDRIVIVEIVEASTGTTAARLARNVTTGTDLASVPPTANLTASDGSRQYLAGASSVNAQGNLVFGAQSTILGPVLTPIPIDADGNLQTKIEPNGNLKMLNFAASTSHSIVLATATRLLGVAVTNRTTTDLVLMIFNATAAQASGAIPLAEYAFPAGGSVVLDNSHFGHYGSVFSSGCVLHLSTTAASLTPFNVISRQNVIGSVRHTP